MKKSTGEKLGIKAWDGRVFSAPTAKRTYFGGGAKDAVGPEENFSRTGGWGEELREGVPT